MKKYPELSDALNSLYPQSSWVIRDSGLEWLSEDIEKPSDDELYDELNRLRDIWEKSSYKIDRENEYPSIENQLR